MIIILHTVYTIYYLYYTTIWINSQGLCEYRNSEMVQRVTE